MAHQNLIAFGFGIGLLATAIGCSRQLDAKSTPTRDLRVAVTPAQAVDHITRGREFTGIVKAARESSLSFERAGRLTAVLVEEGDSVTAGQLLAQIDVESVKAQHAGAVAQLSQARAVLDEFVSGPRKETIAQAQATVEGFDATMRRLQNDLDRSQRLLADKAVSQSRHDANRFGLETATAQRDAAQRQLDELLAGTRAEKITAQQAVVRQLEAQVRSLELEIEDGKLWAPYDGQIVERLTDEGTVVSPGVPVFNIVENHELEAWVGIPVSVTDGLMKGESYSLSIGQTETQGELTSLRTQLDPVTRTRNAIFRLADSSTFVPGQIARLNLNVRINETGYVIPSSALVPGARGLWNLFVAAPNTSPDAEGQFNIEQRSAEVLYTLGEASLVRGTIADDELIVVDGVHRVVAGQPVTVEIKSEGARP